MRTIPKAAVVDIFGIIIDTNAFWDLNYVYEGRGRVSDTYFIATNGLPLQQLLLRLWNSYD